MSEAPHPLVKPRLAPGWAIATVDDIKAPEKHACVAGPFGSSISSKFFTESGVPIIRGSNLSLTLDRFVSEDFAFISLETAERFRAQTVIAGDLVFTCWGSIGQVGLIPQDGPFSRYIISNKQLKLRVDREQVDPLYAYYFFASPESIAYIKGRAIGSAVPGINLGILKSLPIVLPPLNEQHRIVEILGTYDDLINVNRRRVTLLEDMARSLFEEWFVRFRFPGHAGALIEGTPTGPLPSGWRMGTLSDLVEYRKDSTKPGDHLKGRAYVPIECIGRRTLALDEVRPWHEAQSSLQLFDKGDILFGSMRAYFHKVAPAPLDGVTRSTCFVLRPREPHLASYALMQLFRDETVAFASTHSKGSTIPYAQWGGVLERMACPVPELGLTQMFQTAVQPTVDLIVALWESNKRLATSRDLLLPRLISGQLSVAQAERELAHAA